MTPESGTTVIDEGIMPGREPVWMIERSCILRARNGPDEHLMLASLDSDHFGTPAHAAVWRAIQAANGSSPSLAQLHAVASAICGLEQATTILLTDDNDAIAIPAQSWPISLLASKVKEGASLRLRKQAQERLVNPAAQASESLALITQAAALEAGVATERRFSRFSDASRLGNDRSNLALPPSLLGDGLLTEGGFGIIFGQPGTCKSWIGMLLARSIARGEWFLGLPTHEGGRPCGIAQLELHEARIQLRKDVLGIGSHERDAGLHILSRPGLRGPVDLVADGLKETRDWIETKALRLVILDAFSRFHSLDENDNHDMGQLMAGLDSLRHGTGCAILLIHHPRKSVPGGKDDDDMDAMRGSSRMQSDSTLVIRIKESVGKMKVIRWAKVTDGQAPEPIYFHMTDRGPEKCDAPGEMSTKRGEANRDKVLSAVNSGQSSAPEIAAQTGMSRSTIKGHLDSLVTNGHIQRVIEGQKMLFVPFRSDRSDTGIRTNLNLYPEKSWDE